MLLILGVEGEASTALRLQQERKETSMPDFDVGRPELNELLDWVDQPPAQGRDTHAVSFVLRRDFQRGPFYAGLMFYHRGLSPTAGSFQRQHGLSGVAKKVMNEANCEKNFQPVGQPAQELDGHEHDLV